MNYDYVMMLDTKQIDEIAKVAARANLSHASVVSVRSQTATDSAGDAALRITIELTPGSTSSISGEAVVKTLSQIWDRLQEAGDDRFPIIEYATSDELKELTEADD